MADVCLPKKSPNMFRVIYPVMLGLSVLCLLVSNIIYLVLPRKTFLNTIMFHYTLMLFLAYLLLILIQKPELWKSHFDHRINGSGLFLFFVQYFTLEVNNITKITKKGDYNQDINNNSSNFVQTSRKS